MVCINNLVFRKFLLSFTFLIFSSESFAHVDVLLAFMDEEAAPQVKAIVKEHSESNIIVISRTTNGFDGKTLFGFPISYFGFDEGGRVDLSYDDFGIAIQNRVNERLIPVSEKFRKMTHFPSGQKTVENEYIRVLSFSAKGGHPSQDCDSNIVIIQSPEMGKEPDLTLEYMNSLFGAIMDMPAAKPENGGIDFFQFGTGGASAQSAKPGDLVHLQGAVYIGSRRVGDSFQQRISVIYGEDLKKIDFYKSTKLFASSLEAIDDLRKQMANPKSEVYKAMESHEADLGVLRKLELSFTGNLFFGETEKNFGNRFFSSKVVDMEDYLFLESLKHLQKMGALKRIHWEAERLVCDPFEIPETITNSVKNWARSASYTAEDYANFVWWGAVGQSEVPIPINARWDFHFKNSKLEGIKSEIAVLDNISNSVVDPFAAEIGTEFLSDLKMRATESFSDDANLAKRSRQYFVNLFLQSNQDLKQEEIDDSHTENSHFLRFLRTLKAELTIAYEEVKAAVLTNDKAKSDRIILDLLKRDMQLTTHSGRKFFLLGDVKITFEPNYTGPKIQIGRRFQVWLRDNKWPGVKQGVFILNNADINAAAIDRGFYKAGLIYGMKANASNVSQQISESPSDHGGECKAQK